MIRDKMDKTQWKLPLGYADAEVKKLYVVFNKYYKGVFRNNNKDKNLI